MNTEDHLVYTVTAYTPVKAISNIRQLETNSLIFLNQVLHEWVKCADLPLHLDLANAL